MVAACVGAMCCEASASSPQCQSWQVFLITRENFRWTPASGQHEVWTFTGSLVVCCVTVSALVALLWQHLMHYCTILKSRGLRYTKVQPLFARGVCSQCVTCMCLCACAVFQNLVCIHVDNYNFMEIFFPPFLTTTSAAEANSRGRVEAKRSGSLSLSRSLSLSLSLSFCVSPFLCLSPLSLSLSLSFYPSFPLSLIFLRGPDHLRFEPWVDPEPLLSAQVYSNVP